MFKFCSAHNKFHFRLFTFYTSQSLALTLMDLYEKNVRILPGTLIAGNNSYLEMSPNLAVETHRHKAQYGRCPSNGLPFCLQTPTSPRRASNSPNRRTGTEVAVTATATAKGLVSVTRTTVPATPPLQRYQSTIAKRRGLPRALHGQQCFLRAVATALQTLWCTRPLVGPHHRRLSPRTRHYSFTCCYI